jgi:DNA-binding transcriptional regulator YiaG
LQKHVAEQLKVSEDTLTYWENERTLPQIHHYPAIISFLGYHPFDHEVESLSGKLRQIRYCLGLNFRQCAAMLQVSVDAVKRWENGKPIAYLENKQLIEMIWESLPNRFPQHPL